MHPPWMALHSVVVFLRAIIRADFLFFGRSSAISMLRDHCAQQALLHIDRSGSVKISQ